MSSAEATAESHGGNDGKAREHFRNITRDVAWVAESPKPHPLWLAALAIAVSMFAIGIGHAGTLISAVLYLTRQQWRVSINRSAEAMTIFAVMAAGLFPLLHTGRPWFAWWMIPLPNDMGSMWPQFRSPLMWDVFAVTTYLTTSLLFWFMGMVPDLATFRDRNVIRGNKIKAMIYGTLSL